MSNVLSSEELADLEALADLYTDAENTMPSYAEAKKSIADFKSNPTVPQTVESLQEIMARDAVTIEEQDRKIGQQQAQIARLSLKVSALRNRIADVRRAIEP